MSYEALNLAVSLKADRETSANNSKPLAFAEVIDEALLDETLRTEHYIENFMRGIDDEFYSVASKPTSAPTTRPDAGCVGARCDCRYVLSHGGLSSSG